MNAGDSMRMSLLDTAFYLLDGVRSPQDFSLIFHFSNSPDVERFYAGAKSAMNRFPASASVVEGKNWVWRENKYFKLKIVSAEDDSESTLATERFIDEPFDLRHQAPVRQMLILNGSNGARLVTRFHHAAADGLSAALWLGHQLKVAYGLEAVTHERAALAGPTLRWTSESKNDREYREDTGVVQHQLDDVMTFNPATFTQPEEPVMRHRERAQEQLDEVARLHEVIRIAFGDVRVRMM